jgi:hypothetical protein
MMTGIWYVARQATAIVGINRVAEPGVRYVDLHGFFRTVPNHLTANIEKM